MDEFGAIFEVQAKSPTLREIWRRAYEEDYPEDADPLSFVTQTDLNRIIGALELAPGADLVDLACGAGGPGAHVARAADARLTGVDVSAGAIRVARNRHLSNIREGSRFEIGSFDRTGLPPAFADGVMSTDAFFYTQDRAALFREAARIAKPLARLAFSTAELLSHSRVLDAGPVVDYRESLESAGFEIQAYEETPNWEPRMRAVFSGILERREQLKRELGESIGNRVIAFASLRPQELTDTRRVLVVAQRR